MSTLILIRHGQSLWNLEKRFTGWVDVDLTEKGMREAEKAGFLIKERSINIDLYFSSLQTRACNTLKIIQKILDDQKKFEKIWQLNERHYGALTGQNKIEMGKKIGKDKVHELRRSWDLKPEPLDKKSPLHPLNNKIYEDVPKEMIPDTESLKDTYERVINFYKKKIENLMMNNNILISAHGNSIRAICKFLFKLDDKQISSLEIPTGNPLLIKFDKKYNIIECEYLDKDRSNDLLVF